jgi:valyl-tRNA synthetase
VARLAAQIDNDRNKLGNASFLERAPAHVVDEIRKRLADNEAKLEDVRKQLGKLG